MKPHRRLVRGLDLSRRAKARCSDPRRAPTNSSPRSPMTSATTWSPSTARWPRCSPATSCALGRPVLGRDPAAHHRLRLVPLPGSQRRRGRVVRRRAGGAEEATSRCTSMPPTTASPWRSATRAGSERSKAARSNLQVKRASDLDLDVLRELAARAREVAPKSRLRTLVRPFASVREGLRTALGELPRVLAASPRAGSRRTDSDRPPAPRPAS